MHDRAAQGSERFHGAWEYLGGQFELVLLLRVPYTSEINIPIDVLSTTHRPLSSSFLGLPYRILHINHRKELLKGPMGNSTTLRQLHIQAVQTVAL